MKPMNILVGCEFSGVVRNAFLRRGHHAVSCDFQDTILPGPHYRGNVKRLIDLGIWDMMIVFPPCTYLCTSGMWRTHAKMRDPELTVNALKFVSYLLDAPIDKIALENPIGVISESIRKYDCTVQPFEHGHNCSKRTCLWLKNLPAIVPTRIVGKKGGIFDNYTENGHYKGARSKIRSVTFPGIARAMATQWSELVSEEDRVPYKKGIVHSALKSMEIGIYKS